MPELCNWGHIAQAWIVLICIIRQYSTSPLSAFFQPLVLTESKDLLYIILLIYMYTQWYVAIIRSWYVQIKIDLCLVTIPAFGMAHYWDSQRLDLVWLKSKQCHPRMIISFKIAILINLVNLSWIQKMKEVRAEKLWSFSALRNTLTFKAVQRYLVPRLRFIRRFSFLCIWLWWLFFPSEVLCSRNHRKRRNRRRWRCLKRCGCLHAWHLDGVVNTFIIALFFTLYGRQGSLYQLMYQIHYSNLQ